MTFLDRPHRRFNALTGEWVAVSPHRAARPWQGRVEAPPAGAMPAHDPNCYLCPGSVRANGERNPDYDATYVFTNDFPAFLTDTPRDDAGPHPLLRAESTAGTCRVVCFSPRHDLTLGRLSPVQVRTVIDTWAGEVAELCKTWRWVQVFENKGELMGCSNAHPHGQIWASDALPNEASKESVHQHEWFERQKSPLLLDYLAAERDAKVRIVLEDAHWTVVVPWWAVWPFETLVVPRRPVPHLPQLAPPERDALADVLLRLLGAYDRLFDLPFPYSFGWHGAPTDGGSRAHWQLHGHFYPPLLRSAGVRKFMVGYELLAEPQRDFTPEQAAERLRDAVAAVGG
jgi:UDPglucose--hexose-1-phosphate uridylyltransferase